MFWAQTIIHCCNHGLKNESSKALGIDNFDSNHVICEEHFTENQIKNKKML